MAEDSLTALRWAVPIGGVHVLRREVIELAEPSTPEALVLALRDPSAGARLYNPMDAPELLEELAQLPLEPEAFAAFASRWGVLGLPKYLASATERPAEGGQSEPLTPVELVADWQSALEEWRDAFAWWSACSSGDTAFFRAKLPPHPRDPNETVRRRLEVFVGRALYGYSRTYAWGGSSIGGTGSPLSPLLTPRNPLRAARLVLAVLLNEKLRESTSCRTTFNAKTGELELRVSPQTLIGAAWLRLAEAASGGRLQGRRCPRCRRWFIADPSTERRFPRTYCSDACRVAMADRRKRARALAAEGKRAPSIAKALGQDVATVREWIQSERGESRKAPGRRKGGRDDGT